MKELVIQTKRLTLRKIQQDDFDELCNILQDEEVMYAWEKAFSNEEVQNWINENLKRYNNEGYSYLLALDKKTNYVVGVMGPLIESINNKSYIGVAYILSKKSWGKGYATEGAKACIEYAFNELNANEVIAQIRTCNFSSQNVANRLNMKQTGKYIKIYDNKEMEHLIYSIKLNM